MLKHTLKLFFRSLRSNPLINVANLIGLAAGLATCMMIMIFLNHEFRYDSFQPNAHRLVRINTFQQVGGGQAIRIPTASYPVAEGLAAEIPAVENYTRFILSRARQPVYVRDKIFFEEHRVTRRLRALWALWVTDGLSRSLLESCLDDADESIRAWAITLLCEDRKIGGKIESAQFVSLARRDRSAQAVSDR